MAITPSAISNRYTVPPDHRQEMVRLYRSHYWFELRDAVHRNGKPDSFYLGAVACVFDQAALCKSEFSLLLSTHGPEAYQAHKLLMWMYLRRGAYRKVVKTLRTMAVLRPGSSTVESARRLFWALAEYPPLTIASSGPSGLPYEKIDGNVFLPVSINGVNCHAMPDSGASISLVSESDAAHLGMQVRWLGPGTLQVYGATGSQSDFGVAIANQIVLGRFHIKNVVFLVVKDHQFQFPPGYRIALGLPVLLALRTMRWDQNGQFCFGFPSSRSYSVKANLCFDGTDLIANTTINQESASVLIDTGSASTVLWPPIAQRFPGMIVQSNRGSSLVEGISGNAEFPHVQLPEVNLRLGEQSLLIRPAYVLTQATTPNSRWLFGRVGLDALLGSASATIDFNAMSLHLQGCSSETIKR